MLSKVAFVVCSNGCSNLGHGHPKDGREGTELGRNHLLPESTCRAFRLTDKTSLAWTSDWSRECNPKRVPVGNWSLQKQLAWLWA